MDKPDAAPSAWVRIVLTPRRERADDVQRRLAREACILAAIRRARPDGQYEVLVPAVREQEARHILGPRKRAEVTG